MKQTILKLLCILMALTAVIVGGSIKIADLKNSSNTEKNTKNEKGDKQSTMSTEKTLTTEEAEQFYIKEIDDEIFSRMKGKSYKDDCTLPLEDLRYLHILHKNLKGETTEGEMVCNYHIADRVLYIFEELYKADYKIERVELVDNYNAEDELSMEANNSSCFNFRCISYTNIISKHGLGLAVDINTLYNPYVKMVDGKESIEPVTAAEYTDRSKEFPCKIDENDLAYKLFTEQGFEWGGSWTDSKDYQHFEIPDDEVKEWYPDN